MSKSAKKRFCPAVQRDISSAECGDNRVSRYPCPAECRFNPFAPINYEMALALDDALNRKATQHFLETGPDPAATERELVRLHRHASPHALHAWITWRQFFARDDGGRTLMERWEQAGFPGLKNDERVLMKARMHTRIALLEVRRVIDREQVEVVDRLESRPAPFLIRDRSCAGHAVRFSVLLSWTHPMPHFSRLTGSAIDIPDVAQFEPEEVVREIVRHLGGPVDEAGIRLWLAEHFVRFDEALTATALARRADMFAAIDAQWGRVVYELRRPFAECRSLLDDQPVVDLDDLSEAEANEGFSDARVWFDDAVEGPAIGGRAVLGRVLLGQAHWRLEAMGAARTAQLRRQFESLLGTAVRFAGERLDDHAVRLRQKEPPYDRSLVPPRLLEDPQRIVMTSSRISKPLEVRKSKVDFQTELLQAEERRFLESRIPALDDQTPREAARDPQSRPKLIRLIKQRVRSHDQRNLDTGRKDDINWLLRELELTELLFDPPPLRPPPRVPDEEGRGDAEGEGEAAPSELPLPPVSGEPLSPEEVAERVKAVFERFDTAADALAAIDAGRSDFIDLAAAVTDGPIPRAEFDLAVPFLIQARFVLVPPDYREPELDFDSVRRVFEGEIRTLDTIVASGSPDQFARLFAVSRQPALTQWLATQFFEAVSALPEMRKPRSSSMFFLCVLIKVMVDELDRALRG